MVTISFFRGAFMVTISFFHRRGCDFLDLLEHSFRRHVLRYPEIFILPERLLVLTPRVVARL